MTIHRTMSRYSTTELHLAPAKLTNTSLQIISGISNGLIIFSPTDVKFISILKQKNVSVEMYVKS